MKGLSAVICVNFQYFHSKRENHLARNILITMFEYFVNKSYQTHPVGIFSHVRETEKEFCIIN